jgi:hypothetical protein
MNLLCRLGLHAWDEFPLPRRNPQAHQELELCPHCPAARLVTRDRSGRHVAPLSPEQAQEIKDAEGFKLPR